MVGGGDGFQSLCESSADGLTVSAGSEVLTAHDLPFTASLRKSGGTGEKNGVREC